MDQKDLSKCFKTLSKRKKINKSYLCFNVKNTTLFLQVTKGTILSSLTPSKSKQIKTCNHGNLLKSSTHAHPHSRPPHRKQPPAVPSPLKVEPWRRAGQVTFFRFDASPDGWTMIEMSPRYSYTFVETYVFYIRRIFLVLTPY